MSRNALDDCIRADLYHTAGAAVTNFAEKLPAMQGELAQEILKSNYDLGFVDIPLNGHILISIESVIFRNTADTEAMVDADTEVDLFAADRRHASNEGSMLIAKTIFESLDIK